MLLLAIFLHVFAKSKVNGILKVRTYLHSTLVPFYNNNKLNNGFYIALLSPVDVLLSWLQFALIKTSLISPSQQRICLTRITTPPNGYLISRSHCVVFYPRDQHQQHSKAFQFALMTATPPHTLLLLESGVGLYSS